MNRILTIGLLLTLSVSLITTEGALAASKWNIKFGHDQPEKSPHHESALFLKKMIEEGTNGEIKVKIFPSQILGTGLQMVEMVQAGALEMLAIPTSNVQVLQPAFQIFDLPFLFPDKEFFYRLANGKFGEAIYKPLLKKNIVGFSFWESGFKQFTGNFPIHSPDDYKGHKIRVMPAPVIREQFKALGASPVPIDFHELYNALQQGVVDGQENPLTTIVTMKFYEVQKYMTLSNHAFLGYVLIANKDFYNSLPDKYQKLVREAAIKSSAHQRGLIQKREKGFKEKIRKAGVKIIELTPEQRQAFQKAVEPVYDWFVKNVPEGKPYLDMVRSAYQK
ncbi:MAG: TRAP transporter substrate-binding protein [Deltaproteobacteria bacterium]|nr:TRAP transporter substrate-binding protein [Deltaproteobacteria bacterium]MBW2308762.1 TRAP transporter substrate-binding protein [Deltaproteobacteria bacterium]